MDSLVHLYWDRRSRIYFDDFIVSELVHKKDVEHNHAVILSDMSNLGVI